MITLETVEDALVHIQRLREGSISATEPLEFAGELASIRIVIEGPEFRRSVTGELSRGLASYQDEIYRAAKFAILGREGRVQLSAEQRKAFELVFHVNDGCSELVAHIKPIADALAGGITNMDPVTLAVTVVVVTLILTTGYAAIQIVKSLQETKQKGIEATGVAAQVDGVSRIANEAIRSQERLVAALSDQGRRNPVAKRFEQAQEGGIKEVLKSVPTATEVVVADVNFDSDDIKELRRRSPRGKAEWLEIEDDFRVFADTTYTPIRLTLAAPSLPGEFSADFPDDLDAIQSNVLWEAIRSKGTARLVVAAAVIREKVKSALIADVVIPENEQEGQLKAAA